MKPGPLKPPTRMGLVDVKPVRVMTILLNPSTFVGVNVMVALPVAETSELSSVMPKCIKNPLAEEIPGKVPLVVSSSTVVPDIVAAAILRNGACSAPGLMMFVQVKNTYALGLGVPELKVTVNTPDVRVAVAAGL